MRDLIDTGSLPVALVLVFASCISPVSLVWSHGADDRHRDSIEQTIEPDAVYELCLVLTPPQQLRYAFSASHKLGFNIHYHENGAVRYPVADHQTSTAETTFTPESEQEYCLMWTNDGAGPVVLSLQYETGRR